MLKKILYSLIALVIGVVAAGFYYEAQSCYTDDQRRRELESKHASSDYVRIRAVKELCKQHVEAVLDNRRIGYSGVATYHQGVTKIYHDVRVGVYGTSGGQVKFPELSLICLTNIEATKVLQLQDSKEMFSTAGHTDEDENLGLKIFQLGVNATRCDSNPFYKKR